jgi:hypothetical protein
MKTLKIENLICINLQSNNEHLFAVARSYDLDFELIIKLKEGKDIYSDKVSKLWIDVVSYEVVAGIFIVDLYKKFKKSDQEDLGFFHSNDFKLTEDEVSVIKKMKVVSTPKIKKDEATISVYKLAIENGYDLSIRSLDEKIGIDNDYVLVTTASEKVNQIPNDKLERLMLEAVEDEDYELAARLRDQINSRK